MPNHLRTGQVTALAVAQYDDPGWVKGIHSTLSMFNLADVRANMLSHTLRIVILSELTDNFLRMNLELGARCVYEQPMSWRLSGPI